MKVKLNTQQLRHRVSYLERELQRAQDALTKQRSESATVTVYSADDDICVGMSDPKWHRIVCQYKGDVCIGPPREHWRSGWVFGEKGFTLDTFVNHEFRGWRGQHQPGELKYHQLNRQLVALHYAKMQEYVKTLSLWLPGAIYDDVNGHMYAP